MNLMWVCGAEIANLAAVIGLLSRSPVTLGSGLSRQAVGPVASGRSALAASQTAPVANQHRKEVAPNSGSTIRSRSWRPTRATNPGDPGLARASLDHHHGGLRGASAEPVQILGGIDPLRAGTWVGST
jgi:hypothetical protein